MQQRITPNAGETTKFKLVYPAAIAVPDDVFYRVTSSIFTFGGNPAMIRNKLSSNALQIVNVATSEVLVDGMGSYDPTSGTVNIVTLKHEGIAGGLSYLRISAAPANPNTITPLNNSVLDYDGAHSFVTGTVK